jgi:FtsP/CotA-like multicopper oxidase with cupredoxin domain
MKRFQWLSIVTGLLLALTACTSMNHSQHSMGEMEDSSKDEKKEPSTQLIGKQPQTVDAGKRTVEVTAKESTLKTKDGKKWPVWTYNGTVPGPTIRVKQGETLRVKLKNDLPEPVTIHWHGMPVPNQMDGVAGVTQNAVQPGKSFTYQFKADVPGTYWYHSHQDSAVQVDKGLYGAVIVEPKEDKEKVNKDYTLLMDEWAAPEKTGFHQGHSMNSEQMEHGEKSMSEEGRQGMGESSEKGHMSHSSMGPGSGGHMDNYTTYTINGGNYPNFPPLKVKKGDRVKLRFVNAGFMTHNMHIHGHDVKITHVDGHPIQQPKSFRDQLIPVAPGERVDVEFTANQSGTHLVEEHGSLPAVRQMRVPIQYEGSADAKDQSDAKKNLPVVDLTKYSKIGGGKFSTDTSFDRDYTADLGERMDHSSMEEVYTINGKTFKDAKPFMVKKGDKVKLRLKNNGNQDHPMHLHGHTFQVLSKNGKPLKGSPIWKDTINVRPGESYEIAFTAGNPGHWMFHCHDLHHAAGGMMTMVEYEGVPKFRPDPDVKNISE